eukprot:TRINITY_DN3359_c0_g4_i1.p1 TRINITY_DN3359_c0_g4~~TRINITY_DN3359_c0_g4_i1.p1  ORF type:complete len:339 (-),score=105.77 TRINITY_DN3359_c0_g4_i1:2074-3090(-)
MTLSEIAKHNAELADKVISAKGVLNSLINCTAHQEWEVRQQACGCLANIAKHTEALAQRLVDANILPKLINCIRDKKTSVQSQGILCLKEISCHSVDLARTVCDTAEALSSVIEYLNTFKGSKLHGAMILGYTASFNYELAKAVVKAEGHGALMKVLKEEEEGHVKAAAAWSLGQIGKHSAEVAKALIDKNVLEELLEVYNGAEGSKVLQEKAKRSLKSIIRQCFATESLMQLLDRADQKVARQILLQTASVLRSNPEEKKSFIEKGYLDRVKGIEAEEGSRLRGALEEFDELFPPVAEPEVKEEAEEKAEEKVETVEEPNKPEKKAEEIPKKAPNKK